MLLREALRVSGAHALSELLHERLDLPTRSFLEERAPHALQSFLRGSFDERANSALIAYCLPELWNIPQALRNVLERPETDEAREALPLACVLERWPNRDGDLGLVARVGCEVGVLLAHARAEVLVWVGLEGEGLLNGEDLEEEGQVPRRTAAAAGRRLRVSPGDGDFGFGLCTRAWREVCRGVGGDYGAQRRVRRVVERGGPVGMGAHPDLNM